MSDADEAFNRVAKALADPQRFSLLQTITEAYSESGGEACACKRLVERFDVSQATISHHLKELTSAGLITVRREGAAAYLTPVPEALNKYLAELSRRLHL